MKTDLSAPIIIGQRLRRGACGSPRGAARMISDALATIKRLRGVENTRVLFRADSAFYGYASISSAIKAGGARLGHSPDGPRRKKAIATIPDSAWKAIEYTNAIYDEATKTWISNAEVVPGRIASSARRITLHLPEHWPWEKAWTTLFEQNFRPGQPAPI